ncbi:NACHT domain-containing protein [Promicromonospora sp. CA-289599]|uniref:NACHT domain-containing protein n=1 Tax=Promicromonospora sp. CA-289599 TaxID=3240014 RepID=UPI003D89E3A6
MDYLYENLTPEQFQYLAQSIMLRRYPDLQCYPIGQPDGGRDGYSRASGAILQVKFKRRDEESNADWMIASLEGELSKINELVSRGASHYVMATNARGTSHLDRGSMDRVQKWLDEHLKITAEILWRDDVSRRLETMTALALQYPAMLKLTDGIAGLLSGVLDVDTNRRIETLKRFVRHQQQQDRKVKLQQVQDVQLDAELASIFVDIPLGISRELLATDKDRRCVRLRRAVAELVDSDVRRFQKRILASDAFETAHEPPVVVDACALLMNPEVQTGVTRILLHGAPGQGKSTLAQHVCQQHRAAWVEAFASSGGLTITKHLGGVRLPIRVDLKQLAIFLSGGDAPRDLPSPVRTIETFLAGFIQDSAGGSSFSTDDVAWTLRSLPILLFLDGLDEVADLKSRQQVVDAIAEGLARCPEDGDIQVVATSRPSIFGATADLAQHDFVTLELQPLSALHITRLAERWMDARKKTGEDRKSFTKLLREKLKQPHIKDLVRSPMQLTIILSLIDMNGTMLPDGRTDLYEKYLEQVMVREGNKTRVVAEHRDLLVDFLCGLAWEIQLAAEVDGDNGSLTLADLQDKAATFLKERSESQNLVRALFTGSERMYVLVARVQGRYEFEVLPLQEFLCARHMHRTKPVRSSWDPEPSGDLVRRFVTVAANPRWLNVARFLVGMYEPGELAGIPFGLKELLGGGSSAARIQARVVGQIVLADRIFRNRRPYQEEVAAIAYDSIGAHVAQRTGLYSGPVRISSDMTAEVIGETLLALIDKTPNEMPFWPLTNILMRVASPRLARALIDRIESSNGQARTRWLWMLSRVGIPKRGNVFDRMIQLIDSDHPGESELAQRVISMARATSDNREFPSRLVNIYVSEILATGANGAKYRADTGLEFFEAVAGWAQGFLSHPQRWELATGVSQWESSGTVLDGFIEAFKRRWDVEEASAPERWPAIGVIALVETFPDSWLAHLAAIRCVRDFAQFEWFDEIVASIEPELVSAARIGLGGESAPVEWWRSELGGPDRMRRRFGFLVALVAGQYDVLASFSNEVDLIVEDLAQDEYIQLWQDARIFGIEARRDAGDGGPDIRASFGGDAAVLIAEAVGGDPREIVRVDAGPSERLAEWIAVDDWYQKCCDEVEWSDLAAVRRWLALVDSRPFDASDRYVDVTEILRSQLQEGVAVRLLEDSEQLSSEVPEACIDVIMRAHVPEPVKNIVEDENWKFMY